MNPEKAPQDRELVKKKLRHVLVCHFKKTVRPSMVLNIIM